MLQAGLNITSAGDSLKKLQPVDLYRMLHDPKPEVISHIKQLRIIKSIDKTKFTALKKQLPYFVCGIFNPPYRRSENFGNIEYFVIDLDNFAIHDYNIDETRKKIEKDPRTLMSFISPSEDGLKVMFHLKEKCFDSGKYSLFYKCFLRAFSKTYNLEPLIDFRTCDVTRACFISYDPQIYFNENASPIPMEDFLDFNDMTSISQIQKEFKQIEAENKKEEEKPSSDPDKEQLDMIRARLNPKALQKEKKDVFVPIILNDIIPELQEFVQNLGLTVTNITNIQYGKKINFSLGKKLAEINIFYGKRGFSIVQTPKSGTSVELNELAAQCVNDYLTLKEFK